MDKNKLAVIDKALREYPAEIARCAEKEEDARFLLDVERLKLKQIEAKKHLLYKTEKGDRTQNDLKAKVDSDSEVYEQRMAVIQFESAYKKAGIQTSRYVDGFAAARKSANLEIEMARSMNDVIRRNNG